MDLVNRFQNLPKVKMKKILKSNVQRLSMAIWAVTQIEHFQLKRFNDVFEH